jgi:hypothetical protein
MYFYHISFFLRQGLDGFAALESFCWEQEVFVTKPSSRIIHVSTTLSCVLFLTCRGKTDNYELQGLAKNNINVHMYTTIYNIFLSRRHLLELCGSKTGKDTNVWYLCCIFLGYWHSLGHVFQQVIFGRCLSKVPHQLPWPQFPAQAWP